MKKLLALAFLISGFAFFISCNEEDPVNLDPPSVTAPAATSVQVGGTVSLEFSYSAPAGFASSSATGGSVTTDGTADATSGTITVEVTAGSSAGSILVTLEVTDGEGDKDEASVVVEVSESPVPTIAGIPASASITESETLKVAGPIVLTSEDGFAATNAFTLSINGGAEIDLGVTETATSPLELTDVELPTSDLSFGTYEFLFTLTDGDDDEATFLHVLSIVEPSFTVLQSDESRGPDEDMTVNYPQKEVTGIINTNYTFTNDVAWLLNGRVIVEKGATLTIEPGTIIKGSTGQGALSSVLLVASGGKIMAEGTPTEPIIMTSTTDNINVKGLDFFDGTTIQSNSDGFTSTLDPTQDFGLWGGLIILGDATISSGDGETTVIEGIPSTVPQAIYGGTNDAHNGGVVKYVSIRFTGTQLGPGNELQGLTLGGVGSGTVIDHVESIASADDGIEIFGGTVDISNFIVWAQEDDGYDCDQAWTGTVDNFVYIGAGAGAAWDSDHAFELDGPEGSILGSGSFTNGVAVGLSSSGMIDFRDGAVYSASNILFVDFAGSADIELDAGDANDECEISASYLADELLLTNLEFFNNGVATLAAVMDNKCATGTAAADADTKFAAATNGNMVLADIANRTVGADLTDLAWSYTAAQYADWADIPSSN